ncbi:GIY-YIG nuclease family protein [Photobacterium lucens]|uniref:GIY-YIG nuclease family protein n=1 Tax=Photobacterium lucens TaxID=2562949 RepID=UPI00136C2676|nr:GIY-YIG nuclease family protein [Photobacterium lucens]MBP2701149.1 GIY-YIG nuclease family protein [Vibrio parahaemolyticus]MZG55987.1 GIY-YIG nuclease family protein [Photobacterium lucens]MZG81463.1 GIY-YIG nuclease family protein [Photobacterium lucens]
MSSEETQVITPWYVYLIRTSSNSLYCGVTTDVERRFNEHQHSKKGAKYLKGKGPLTLAWSQQVRNKRDAMVFEYKIKKTLTKQRKEQLITTDTCLYQLFPQDPE